MTWLRAIVVLSALLALTSMAVSVYLYVDGLTRDDEIQGSRAYGIRISCQEQNVRNDDTLQTFDRVTLGRLTGRPIGKGLKYPELRSLVEQAIDRLPERQALQLRQSRDATRLLVDALAPRRDCEARVRSLLGPRSKSSP